MLIRMNLPGYFCRLFAILVVGWLVFGAGCAEFEFVGARQPLVVEPRRPRTHALSGQDLAPLAPDVRTKLRDNIKALRLYILQWEETVKLYNKGVKERNEAVRRRLQE